MKHGIRVPRRSVCGICGEKTVKPTQMCRACDDVYERDAHQDGSVLEAMLWAARRSRWYAERRGR